MSDIYILTILEIVVIGLCFSSEIFLLKKFKETRNYIFLGVILFLITIQLYALSQIYTYNSTNPLTFGASLTISTIIWLNILNLQALFYFYLKKLRTLYTLPLITSFFIGAGLILAENTIPLIIYSIISGFAIAFLLIIEGNKNKNGLSFSLGISIIIMGIGVAMDQFLLLDLFRLILSILGLIIFNLGLYGIFEKYFLLDKSEKEKIKNTWISRLVIDKKKK